MEQHAANRADVGLDSLRQTLRAVLSPCFGPLGRDVLIARNTGGFVSSNNGFFILECLQLREPCAKLALDTARRRHDEFGDGSSALFLCLAEGLEAVERRLSMVASASKPFMRAKFARALSHVRTNWLPEVVLPALAKHCTRFDVMVRVEASASEADMRVDPERAREEIRPLVEAVSGCVLCSKFSPGTCKELTRLVLEITDTLLLSTDGSLQRGLVHVAHYFLEDLCYEVTGEPVSSSQVLPGHLVLLPAGRQAECRKWLDTAGQGMQDQHTSTRRCALYFVDTDPASGWPGGSMEIPTARKFSSLLVWQSEQGERLAATIAARHPAPGQHILVLTSSTNASLSEHCRRHAGMLTLQCNGGRKAMHNIASMYKCSVYDMTSRLSNQSDTITMAAVTVKQIGVKTYLHIASTVRKQCHDPACSLQTCRSSQPHADACSTSAACSVNASAVPPITVTSLAVNTVVCAASAQLCRLYSDSVVACLRALSGTFALPSAWSHHVTLPPSALTGEVLSSAHPRSSASEATETDRHGSFTSLQYMNSTCVSPGLEAPVVGGCTEHAQIVSKEKSNYDTTISSAYTIDGGGFAEMLMSASLLDRSSRVTTLHEHGKLPHQTASTSESHYLTDDHVTLCDHAIPAIRQDQQEAAAILGEALACIPRLLHQHAHGSSRLQGGATGFCRYVECQANVTHAYLTEGKFPMASSNVQCNVLRSGALVQESLLSKYRLLEDLCSVLEQLLRVDLVVKCKRLFCALKSSKKRLKSRCSMLEESDEEQDGDEVGDSSSEDDS